jgi:NADP-dependent 3-hydroxy acid dehydrogenase YdfG
MENVQDKVIVITGASSGIGAATALMLAKNGAKVVLGARGLDGLASLAETIKNAGGDVVYAQTDVKDQQQVTALVALAITEFGKIDVLINNAGIGPISPLDDLKVAEWEDMVDINIKGVLYGIAAALPIFRQQGFGHIITTGSTAGLKTVPNQVVYSGTKFAVRAIMEGLRQEAGKNLRVTLISPGFVNTNFVSSISNPDVKAQLTEMRDQMAIPADAIANAIVYAIAQPSSVDVGEIIVRPTAQG